MAAVTAIQVTTASATASRKNMGKRTVAGYPVIRDKGAKVTAKVTAAAGGKEQVRPVPSENRGWLRVARWAKPGPTAIDLWAFDILAFNGRDLRPQPLAKRQMCLQALLERFGCPAISLSEPFEDGLVALRVAEKRGLEGLVSKRRVAPYRSGECCDWRMVKTLAWRDEQGAVAAIRVINASPQGWERPLRVRSTPDGYRAY